MFIAKVTDKKYSAWPTTYTTCKVFD